MRSPTTMFRLSSAVALAAAITLAGCGPAVSTATHLSLSDVPTTVTAGQPLEITVTVKNKDGEVITGYNSSIGASVDGPAGNEVLVGESEVKATEGVAKFTLALTRAGSGQKIVFRPAQQDGSRLVVKVTPEITVGAAAAEQLTALAHPRKGAPGGILYPYPVVQVSDKYGNLVTSAQPITVSLGTNPTGAVLGGTLTATTIDGRVEFPDLTVDRNGAGYKLSFGATGVTPTSSDAFDVGAPKLAYTDPVAGPIRLVKKTVAEDGTWIVLELKVFEDVSGAYAAGFNLPVDLRCVKAPSAQPILTLGNSALDPGLAPVAAVGALHTQGVGAGILTAGLSQKASGAGAVLTHKTLAAGTVLFSVRLDVVPTAVFKTAFDGATPGTGFAASVRNREGADVSRGFTWGFGKLEIQ